MAIEKSNNEAPKRQTRDEAKAELRPKAKRQNLPAEPKKTFSRDEVPQPNGMTVNQGLQESDGSLEAFQNAVAARAQDSLNRAQQIGSQLADLQAALPMVVEQAYQQRVQELGGQGQTLGNFPAIAAPTQRPALDIFQLSAALPATNPRLAIEGAESTASQPGLKAMD